MEYKCPICGYTTDNQEEYWMHMAEHNKEQRAEVEKKVAEAAAAAREKYNEKMAIFKEAKFKEIEKHMDAQAAAAHAGNTILIAAATAAGTFSMSGGDAADEVFRFPSVSAMNREVENYFLSNWNNVINPLLRRHQYSQFTPLLPDVRDLIIMAHRKTIDSKTYWDAMHEQGLSQDWTQRLYDMQWLRPPTPDLINMLRRGLLNADTFDAEMRKNLLDKYWSEKYRNIAKNTYPEPYQLAEQASKRIIPDDIYKSSMKIFGLDSGWADTWREAQYVIPPFSQLAEMKWRGLLTDQTFEYLLNRSGILPGTTKHLQEIIKLIPPPADLVTMVVREAFLPERILPAPAVFAKYMKMKGFSKEWSDRYWTSHYLPMPLAQAYDNLYRKDHWEDEFKKYLKWADFHPDDHQLILDVAYRPPTVRELGYGYDVGAYTREDIVKFRRWGGLSPEDAKKAAGALVDYRLEAEREAVRREYLYLFVQGKITEEEFRKNLEDVFNISTRSDLWVERGKLQTLRKSKPITPVEYRVISSSEAKWHFTHGLRDEAWYAEKLADLDWDEERIAVAVERARAEMKEPAPVEPPVEYRKLSTAQIGDLYRFRKLSAEALPAAFEKIGYSPADAAMLAQVLVEVSKPKVRRAELSRADVERMYDLGILTEEQLIGEYAKLGYDDEAASYLALRAKISVWFPDLKAMYSKGWITADTMFKELMRLGLPRERAEYLMMTVVKTGGAARVSAERDLTKSEILKGAKSGLLTVTQASRLLQDLGYDEGEAAYLLVLNKVIAAGDPEGYWDMKRVTEAYKRAMRITSKEVPEQLVLMEARLREMKSDIEARRAEGVTDEALAEHMIALNSLEANYRRAMQEWEREV